MWPSLTGGSLQGLFRGFFSLRASECKPSNKDLFKVFEHESFRAALISQHGFFKKTDLRLCAPVNVIQIGGIGNTFECNIEKCIFLAKTFQDGESHVNVWTLDHTAQWSLTQLIESIERLYDFIKIDSPHSKIYAMGHSLGTGLLLNVGTRRAFDAFVLQCPYEDPSNLLEVDQFQFLSPMLLGTNLNARKLLPKIITKLGQKTPLIVQTSTEDTVLLPQHQKRIVKEARQFSQFDVSYFKHAGSHSQYLWEDLQIQIWSLLSRASCV